tara:strand:- start:192 stop:434 length:243 start_codon:yes stop_codon:yes gene_type:complete
MMGHIKTKGNIIRPHPRKQTLKDLSRADFGSIFFPFASEIFVLSIHFPNVVEKQLRIKVSVITHEMQIAEVIVISVEILG